MLRITTEPVTFGADATEYVGLLNTYSYICHRKKTYCILVPFYVKIKIIFGTVYCTLYRTAYLLWTRIRLDLALSCRIEFDVSHLERILHDNDHILIFTKEKKETNFFINCFKTEYNMDRMGGSRLRPGFLRSDPDPTKKKRMEVCKTDFLSDNTRSLKG